MPIQNNVKIKPKANTITKSTGGGISNFSIKTKDTKNYSKFFEAAKKKGIPLVKSNTKTGNFQAYSQFGNRLIILGSELKIPVIFMSNEADISKVANTVQPTKKSDVKQSNITKKVDDSKKAKNETITNNNITKTDNGKKSLITTTTTTTTTDNRKDINPVSVVTNKDDNKNLPSTSTTTPEKKESGNGWIFVGLGLGGGYLLYKGMSKKKEKKNVTK